MIMSKIEWLRSQIEVERNTLIHHPLYAEIDSIEKIKIFMQNHVFAVWDFMSLLKALQIKLTCVNLPWTPSAHPNARRLINEIVFAEESDVNARGEAVSHYEMYRESMLQLGADTSEIDAFVESLTQGNPLASELATINIDDSTRDFVAYTFDIIHRGKAHEIAALFTFGREDLIPDMFSEIVKNLGQKEHANVADLVYYLDRHIELDGDEHGPLALKLIEDLCGTDDQKWQEAMEVSKKGLQQRNLLWNGILEQLSLPVEA
jgi:hypothetical protein